MTTTYIKPRQHFEGMPLSKREQQVAEMVSEGMTRVQIGKVLCLSPHTIDAVCKQIALKTGYRKNEYWRLRKDLVIA